MFAEPAGADEPRARTRELLPLLALSLAVAACSGDSGRSPAVLLDGSPAMEVAVELEGVPKTALLTKVRVIGLAEVEQASPSASCLRGRARGARPTGMVVERIGVMSESVTIRDRSGLHSCDDGPGRRAEARRWCSGAFGALVAGRLSDPRLSVGCTTREGAPLGFVWIEPDPSASYVAVAQSGFVEVYEVTGGLPVRVATAVGVDIEGSRATFHLSEHDSEGRLIRKYELAASVAA